MLGALRIDAFVDAVDADAARARELGVTGVPTFVLAGRYMVSGAQPVEALRQALGTAWTALATPTESEATSY